MAQFDVYLQVKKGSRPWQPPKVVRATGTKPRVPVSGALLVKVTVRIDDKAFLPLEPEAHVDVPMSATQVVVAGESPRLESVLDEVRQAIDTQIASALRSWQPIFEGRVDRIVTDKLAAGQ